MNDPVARLLGLCRRLVDPDAQPIGTHPGHNGTVALRASTAHGHVIIKTHRGIDRHRQEVYAYTHWTATLRDRAPRLLAVSDEPPAIVITALFGRPLAKTTLTPSQEAEAHRQAGELLHDLHSAAPPVEEPNMSQWLAERGERWLTHARHLLPHGRCAEIRAHLRALSRLDPIAAVPCHLDYTPRNLMCGITEHSLSPPTTQQRQPARVPTRIDVAAFDFEHARYDLAARDLVRLADRVWRHRPDLEDAFLRGYGPLTALDQEVIEHCTHLDSLTKAVRAAQRPATLETRSNAIREAPNT
jgi:Ser/Thr protein kinase RdoA (MazF antagonist)